MVPVSHPFRPTRRAWLAGMMALGVLPLATGCDRTNPAPPVPTRRPVALELAAMEADPALRAPAPVIDSGRILAAGTDRPLCLVLGLRQSGVLSCRTLTLDRPDGVELPLPRGAVRLEFCAEPDAARVLALTVDEAGRRTWHVLSSVDAVTWSDPRPVEGLSRGIDLVQAGIVIEERADSALPVRRLEADGSVLDLGAIPMPEGSQYEPRGIAVAGTTLVLLADVRAGDAAAVPATLVSHDDGATWSEPAPLMSTGAEPWAAGICAIAGGFVVSGSHEVRPPEGDTGERYAHPVAWASADGAVFTEEAVPLPHIGTVDQVGTEDGFAIDADGNTYDPGAAVWWEDLTVTAPLASVDGSGAVLTISWADTMVRAARAADGTWSVQDPEGHAGGLIRSGFTAEGTTVVVTDTEVAVHRDMASAPAGRLDIASVRSTTAAGGAGSAASGGTVRWRTSRVLRHGYRYAWERPRAHAVFLVGPDGLAVMADEPADASGAQVDDLWIADDGRAFLTGEATGLTDDGSVVYGGARLWLRGDDGTWTAAAGLPTGGAWEARDLRRLGDEYVLAGATAAGRENLDDSDWTGALWTSPDGLTWTPRGTFPPETLVTSVQLLGSSVVALGSQEIDDTTCPAVFLLDGEAWRPTTLAVGSRAGVEWSAVVDDQVRFRAGVGDVQVMWTLTPDGSVLEIERVGPEDDLRWDEIDLGGGARIATGEHGGGGTARSSVVWASADAGEHWDPIAIPGVGGREPTVSLARLGEDVVVLVDEDDGPAAFRIADARAAIGAQAPAGFVASDGGGS